MISPTPPKLVPSAGPSTAEGIAILAKVRPTPLFFTESWKRFLGTTWKSDKQSKLHLFAVKIAWWKYYATHLLETDKNEKYYSLSPEKESHFDFKKSICKTLKFNIDVNSFKFLNNKFCN